MSAINNTFYKGYGPTQNKKCLMKFKGVDASELMTAEQVQSLPEYAGILAPDAVLYDNDDMQQSELFLEICDKEGIRCKVLQSRSGMHFLFKNSRIDKCYTKTKVACGLTFDIKSGFKNSYEVLKIDGKERTVLYDILEGEEYQEVPKWLFPIKSNVDFTSMKAGDGRNQALFNYILTLQAADFTIDEIKQCIRIMNTYILKEPLPESEIDVILRDEAFKKQAFFKNRTFLHDVFAEHIKRTYNIKKINGQLHIYCDGVYVSGDNQIKKAMLKEISSLTDAKRTEVMKQLDLICDEYTIDEQNANMIAFRNGIYDLETDSLKPFSPDIVITNRIPWDYNPTAYSELADKTLDKIACHDAEIRTILEECIGSCFYRSNTLGGGKAFILTGEGSNGKSTFIEVLQTVLGESNYSVLDLKNLDAKFSTIMLVGKLANLGDDISDEFNSDISVFKKIVTGNYITAQQKGQPEFQFKPFCKLLFSANNIPRIKDRTGAAQRRLLIIPFEAKFSKTDADYDNTIIFKLKAQESIEYFIRIGIEGLKRVLLNSDYTSSTKVDKELEEYRISNDPVLSFVEEVGVDSIENEPTKDVFLHYSAYCVQNGFKPLSNIVFSKQICRILNFGTKQKKVQNKKYQIFCKVVQDDC